MKYLLLLLFLLVLVSCLNPKDDNPQVDLINPTNDTLIKHHTKLDTIYIITARNDSLMFGKDQYNQIIDKHLEFFDANPQNPEIAYFANYDFTNFGSEAGQDNYYILYAHFLKQEHKDLDEERAKLIEIYTLINSLYAKVQYGGTYFGHQYKRILGFAEYRLSLMPNKNAKPYKPYPIDKQKAIYIKSLNQFIKDEVSVDILDLMDANSNRVSELNDIVSKLDSLITDRFYLQSAQAFQYSNY